MTPPTRAVRCSTFICTAVIALAVLAACEKSEAPLSIEPAFAPGGPTSPVEFTVVGPNGPVAQATVRVYTGDGPVPGATGLTDVNGFVSFELPRGDYCASVRLVTPNWLNSDGSTALDLVTPATPFANPFIPTSFLEPVVRTESGYEVFSPENFHECYTELPIAHRGSTTAEAVTLSAVTPLPATLKDPNGNDVPAGNQVYAVIPVCGVPGVPNPPWVDCSDEIKPAFFSFLNLTGSPAQLTVPTGVPFALEFQGSFSALDNTGTPRHFNLTASGVGTGGDPSATLTAAPLICEEPTGGPAQDPAGEQTIDFLQANYGYHASLALTPDLGVASVELQHTGVGSATVSFRTDPPGGGRFSTTVDFSCDATGCGNPIVTHTGTNNPQWVLTFFKTLSSGRDKTTIVLGGIPNHTKLTFSAKSAGDAMPNPSKKNTTSAFFELKQPRSCSVLGGNDDKWFVGEV
jgi:hypothetical protein